MKSYTAITKTFVCGVRTILTLTLIAAATSARAGTTYKVIHGFGRVASTALAQRLNCRRPRPAAGTTR
jgi:hypothetical protein